MIEEVLIFGLVQGSLLALLALGFSLVYGVGGILNLAHGAFFLMTAYIMYWTIPLFGLYIAAIIALVAIVGIGAITYLGLVKPLHDTPLGVVLVTFALAFFFEQFVKYFLTMLRYRSTCWWDRKTWAGKLPSRPLCSNA